MAGPRPRADRLHQLVHRRRRRGDVVAVDRRRSRCRIPRHAPRAAPRAVSTPGRTRRSRCSRRRRSPAAATRRRGSPLRGTRRAPVPRRRRTRPRRCRRPRSWAAVAAPTAIGRPAATIPFAPKIPRPGSAMCIEPPRPRFVPCSFAHQLGEHPGGSRPFARQWPWPRWVDVMTSSARRGQQAPTAAASWPIDRCTKPGTSPSRYSAATRCSNPRMTQHPPVHLDEVGVREHEPCIVTVGTRPGRAGRTGKGDGRSDRDPRRLPSRRPT